MLILYYTAYIILNIVPVKHKPSLVTKPELFEDFRENETFNHCRKKRIHLCSTILLYCCLQLRVATMPTTMEPEGDQPVKFQFETRLGAEGNVEGRVVMQKEGVKEPMLLDFSMMLSANENGATAGGEESHNVTRCLEPPSDAVVARPMPSSPSRLSRALQRLTKRRRRSPDVLDSNQSNSWGHPVCAECRAPLTATTASVSPGRCAACAGPAACGDSELSSVSTLTTTDSWELASATDHARADSPQPSGRFQLTSPPRRDRDRRHLVSDLMDRVARLSSSDAGLHWELADPTDDPDSGALLGHALPIPHQPRVPPRAASAAHRRERAEQRLQAASAFLRKSLTRSIAANAPPASLRKPVFFRDLRSNR